MTNTGMGKVRIVNVGDDCLLSNFKLCLSVPYFLHFSFFLTLPQDRVAEIVVADFFFLFRNFKQLIQCTTTRLLSSGNMLTDSVLNSTCPVQVSFEYEPASSKLTFVYPFSDGGCGVLDVERYQTMNENSGEQRRLYCVA